MTTSPGLPSSENSPWWIALAGPQGGGSRIVGLAGERLAGVPDTDDVRVAFREAAADAGVVEVGRTRIRVHERVRSDEIHVDRIRRSVDEPTAVPAHL